MLTLKIWLPLYHFGKNITLCFVMTSHIFFDFSHLAIGVGPVDAFGARNDRGRASLPAQSNDPGPPAHRVMTVATNEKTRNSIFINRNKMVFLNIFRYKSSSIVTIGTRTIKYIRKSLILSLF